MEKCQYCLNDNTDNTQIPISSCEASTDNNYHKTTIIYYKCRNNHKWTKIVFFENNIEKNIEYDPPIRKVSSLFQTANDRVITTNPGLYRRSRNLIRNVMFGSVRPSLDPVYESNISTREPRDPRYLRLRHGINPTPTPSPNTIADHEIDMD